MVRQLHAVLELLLRCFLQLTPGSSIWGRAQMGTAFLLDSVLHFISNLVVIVKKLDVMLLFLKCNLLGRLDEVQHRRIR